MRERLQQRPPGVAGRGGVLHLRPDLLRRQIRVAEGGVPRPALGDLRGQLRMELHRPQSRARAEGLDPFVGAGGQQHRVRRQLRDLVLMPVEDGRTFRAERREDGVGLPGLGQGDPLQPARGLLAPPHTPLQDQGRQLCAQADAQRRQMTIGGQGQQPTHPRQPGMVGIVEGTHPPAQHHHSLVPGQVLGKLLAEMRLEQVHVQSRPLQHRGDHSRRADALVLDHQDIRGEILHGALPTRAPGPDGVPGPTGRTVPSSPVRHIRTHCWPPGAATAWNRDCRRPAARLLAERTTHGAAHHQPSPAHRSHRRDEPHDVRRLGRS